MVQIRSDLLLPIRHLEIQQRLFSNNINRKLTAKSLSGGRKHKYFFNVGLLADVIHRFGQVNSRTSPLENRDCRK